MTKRRFPASRSTGRARGFAVGFSRLSRAIDAVLLKRAGGVLLAAGAGLGLAAAPGLAWADSFTVTKLADTNDGVCDADCSLREAIAAANANAGADTVVASGISGTITLADVADWDFMFVTDALTILGPGKDALVIDAHDDSRFFSVTEPSADFTLKGMTLANGHTVGHGGAIYSSANLTLEGVMIVGAESASKGGAISVANADLTITSSTITGSVATTDGGGIYVNGGDTTLTNSTISHNIASLKGGGVYVHYGDVSIADEADDVPGVTSSRRASKISACATDQVARGL